MEQIAKLYTLLVVSCLLLAGCSNDEDAGNFGDPVAVQFGTGKIARLKTTAEGDQWTLNNTIGIFMIRNGQSLSSANIAESADNREYQAQTGNSNQSGFIPVGTDIIYYPQNGDKVDFIAYYPHKTTLTNYIYPIDVSNQATPEDIDVLYSNNAKGYNKNSGTVDLQFNHALSKLSFTLEPGDNSPILAGAKIEIINLATTANLDMADGSVTTTNSGQTLTADTTSNELSSSAIVIPQALSGTKLIVTLADNVSKFEWDFTTTEFQTGKNYQYTITVSKTGIIVNPGNITTWTGTSDPATTGTTYEGYKVGDYYPDPTAIYQNGVLISGTAAIGIVFWLDNQDVGDYPYSKVSQHGKVVGLYEDAADTWTDTWANNYGTTYNAGAGWALPTVTEINYLYCSYNSMNYERWILNSGYDSKPSNIEKHYTERSWFRAKITNAGGNDITDDWYWASPQNKGYAPAMHFNSGNLLLYYNIFKSRAIKSF